jgi:hypothetical protein
MYRCKNFTIEELVPQYVYIQRGEKAWELLDEKMLRTLDRLRDHFGRMKINDWVWSGERQWSGLRTPDSPFYSPYSQHTFGRAFDILFLDAETDEVRGYILEHPGEFPEIGGVELGVSWLHIDGRNHAGIKTFEAPQ